MKAWLRAAATAAAIALVSACGSDGDSGVAAPLPAQPTVGTVAGTVSAAMSAAPVANATVRIGALSATTAADGGFSLPGVPTGTRVMVRFEAAGYAPSFAAVDVAANQTADTAGVLTPVGASSTVSAAVANTVTVPGSTARVVLPANSLVDAATNAPATGNVTVSVTPIDPARDAASMPGDYTIASGASIESFGAIQVDLRDGGGNRLNLAAGQSAVIRIPLASRSADPPATLPLFYFNETTGRWVQEGTANLAGAAPNRYYEGTVTHFTFWNADKVLDTITVTGCVQNAQGQRAAGAQVESLGIDYVGRAFAFTDGNGAFTVAIRRQGTALVDAKSFNPAQHATAVSVGPSNANVTLTQCLVLNASVARAPVIVTQPQSQAVNAGGEAVFYVSADGGGAPLRYQWRRAGQNIADETSSYLSITNVQPTDNGAVFSVVVSNGAGQVTSSDATLTVTQAQIAPTITSQPSNQSVIAGQTATFSVTATGTPSIAYQWQRQGQNIAGATGSSYTTPATTLADNEAQFTVVVSNGAGSVTSQPATLTVSATAVAPTITVPPANISVDEGTPATFSVTAAGVPAPSYQWQRGTTNIVGATGSTYTLGNPTIAADNGATFRVVVTNSAGSVTSSAATLSVTQNNAANVARLAFLALEILEPATSAIYLTDDNGVFLTSAGVCPDGGSVAGTLNGAAFTPGAAAPLSGTLAATFADCVPSSGTTFNGTNSLQYNYTTSDFQNGSITGTMTNMRVVERSGATVDRDITGNGTVSATLSTTFAGSQTTERTTISIGANATLRSGLSGLTATFLSGAQELRFTYEAPGSDLITRQVVYTQDAITFTVAGTTYVANGTLQGDFDTEGLFTAGIGQVTITANAQQVGRIFFDSAGRLSIEANGQVVPFARPVVRPLSRRPGERVR